MPLQLLRSFSLVSPYGGQPPSWPWWAWSLRSLTLCQVWFDQQNVAEVMVGHFQGCLSTCLSVCVLYLHHFLCKMSATISWAPLWRNCGREAQRTPTDIQRETQASCQQQHEFGRRPSRQASLQRGSPAKFLTATPPQALSRNLPAEPLMASASSETVGDNKWLLFQASTFWVICYTAIDN